MRWILSTGLLLLLNIPSLTACYCFPRFPFFFPFSYNLELLCEDVPLITDFVLEFSTDEESQRWELYRMGKYQYNEDNLVKSVTYKYIRNYSYSHRILYYYDNYKNNDLQVFQYWIDNRWHDSIQYIFEYNQSNLIDNVTTQYWDRSCSCWESTVISRRYYNEKGQPDYYVLQLFRDDKWMDYQISYFYYENDLQTRYVTYRLDNDLPRRQYLYKYNSRDLMTERLTQLWNHVESFWYDYQLTTYEYNESDHIDYRIDYVNVDGEWEKNSKFIYFYKPAFDWSSKKVPICHKGHTIYVSHRAVHAHLRHGDCLGECAVQQDSENQGRKKSLVATTTTNVFPNPASDKIILTGTRTYTHGELVDMTGQKIMEIDFNNSDEIRIDCSHLRKGLYLIRFYGEQDIHTEKIIIQD